MSLTLVVLAALAFAPAPTPAAHPPVMVRVPRLSHEASPGIRIWTSRGDLYQRGDRVRVYYRTERDAYVTIFRVDTDGRVSVLFPRTPGDENLGYGGTTYTVSSFDRGDAFYVDDYAGVGYIFAIASSEPFNYDAIAGSGHWDMRYIADGRIHGDPRASLEEVTARLMASGYSDYDSHLVPYYVERRYDYPRFVCYDCHAYTPYAYWDPYSAWCRRFTLVVYNDPYYFYPSYWYPARYYGGSRVVYSSPGVIPQRFVFKNRDAASGPGVDYRDRRVLDVAANRRPEDRGVRAADIGGVGSVPAPRVTGERRIAPPVGGTGGGETFGGEDRRRTAPGNASGSFAQPPTSLPMEQGGRRRIENPPAVEIVPRHESEDLRRTAEPRPEDPRRYVPAPQREQPVIRGDQPARPQLRDEPRDQPRPELQRRPEAPSRAETAPSRPEAAPSRPEPRREAPPAVRPSAPPREAAPRAQPAPRSSPPPAQRSSPERRRP